MLRIGISGYQIWYHSIVIAEELLKSGTMRVVSVFDENPVFAKRLGEAAGGAKVFTDVDEFVDSGIDKWMPSPRRFLEGQVFSAAGEMSGGHLWVCSQ